MVHMYFTLENPQYTSEEVRGHLLRLKGQDLLPRSQCNTGYVGVPYDL